MIREEFEKLVAEEFPGAIPEEFRAKISNVAFLIEDEPSLALRQEEGLAPNETLLGHYRGIPHTARGDYYGMGATLPDTITLFQIPIENEAEDLHAKYAGKEIVNHAFLVREVVRDTIWHELAHHFGMDESAVRRREDERQRGL